MIYLDNAATTRILPCAIAAMDEVFAETFGNPNSSHLAGQQARAALEEGRKRIARCINANPEEIYFTSGATEASQIAMQILSASCGVTQVSAVEHHAVLDCPVRTSSIPRIGLVQMLANNETGERFEMPRREHANDLIFTDATAAMGHMDIDVKRLNVDMLAAGGHKFGAPCGIGFLYARHGIEVHRSGTPPVALACSMASALEWQTEHMVLNTETVSQKRNDLEWLLTNRFGGERILINTPPKNRLPHILNVSFDGVDGKALALMLSHCGVMVSAGAACTSGDNAPSHVLMAMYHDEARARSAIRISLSHENTVSECEQAAKIIAECVEQLRAIS